MESKSVLIVVDYQGCFLPGGGLATNQGPAPVTGDPSGQRVAKELDTLIKTNKFSTVFFTKDMHHPDNVSINDKNPFTANDKFYAGRPMARVRNWVKNSDRLLQKKWPRHCTMPPMNPFYSKLVRYQNLKGMNGSRPVANVIGSKINNFLPQVASLKNAKVTYNSAPKHYGAELPYALAKYEQGKPAGVQSEIVEVYKGFAPDTDSYSAVADAVGEFTPFVARENGRFVDPDGPLEPFMDRLQAENPTDIYLAGIARDVCVYWTAMDILNFWVFPAIKAGKPAPRVHFIYDLTRPVGSVPVEFNAAGVPTKFVTVDISKAELHKSVGALYNKVTGRNAGASNDYFFVTDARVAAEPFNANNVNNASKWHNNAPPPVANAVGGGRRHTYRRVKRRTATRKARSFW
jgi:nicotinamidase-related amidase